MEEEQKKTTPRSASFTDPTNQRRSGDAKMHSARRRRDTTDHPSAGMKMTEIDSPSRLCEGPERLCAT